MSVSKSIIEKNVERIRADIVQACRKAGRHEQEISIIAVTKTVEIDAVAHALELGIADLGESRVQQLTERAAELEQLRASQPSRFPHAPRWHMIGHLQRNKVKQVMDAASVIHSVDSLRLAEDISDRGVKDGRTTDIMLQVNCSQEPQKHGCAVGAAMHLAGMISTLKNIRLVGLMTMAQLSGDAQKSRPAFALLREMFEELRHNGVGGAAFRHLSMGMSQDYAVAVEEGATMVRIGSAMFGEEGA